MSPPPPAAALVPEALHHVDGAMPSLTLAGEAQRLRRQAFVAALVAAACIGFSPIFVRLADVGPAAIGFWRLLFALGPTALWAYAERREALVRRSTGATRIGARHLAFGALAGFFFAVDLILFHAGLARTTTANGVLLGNLAPVFVLLMAWLLLGERPTLALMTALALALGGAAVIVLASTSSGGAGAASVTGDLMCAIAASTYAAYMLVVRMVRRAGSTTAMSGGMVALLSSAAGALFCLAWAVGTGEQIVPASLRGFLAVAGLGVVTHAVGQGLATFALGRLQAGTVSIVLLVQVVVGISMAALVFGEFPSFAAIVGGSLIVLGVLAVRPR
ncbi:DMT family transporter [Ancylobacter terrae]|uniref:DMT family transporter n=1 Tax=Ancylobacter sp. sgz301288 TaxID=3342077 RepID=UPI003859F2BE